MGLIPLPRQPPGWEPLLYVLSREEEKESRFILAAVLSFSFFFLQSSAARFLARWRVFFFVIYISTTFAKKKKSIAQYLKKAPFLALFLKPLQLFVRKPSVAALLQRVTFLD